MKGVASTTTHPTSRPPPLPPRKPPPPSHYLEVVVQGLDDVRDGANGLLEGALHGELGLLPLKVLEVVHGAGALDQGSPRPGILRLLASAAADRAALQLKQLSPDLVHRALHRAVDLEQIVRQTQQRVERAHPEVGDLEVKVDAQVRLVGRVLLQRVPAGVRLRGRGGDGHEPVHHRGEGLARDRTGSPARYSGRL